MFDPDNLGEDPVRFSDEDSGFDLLVPIMVMLVFWSVVIGLIWWLA